MKRNIILLAMGILLISMPVNAQLCSTCPKDNPMATFYADSGDYAYWTDEVMWNIVIDMSAYSNGADNFARFENARDELYNTYTGGVLYYPAGTYRFTTIDSANGRGLMLKKGVVIRGETPSSDKSAITTLDIENMSFTDHGLNSLPTKFYFKRTNIVGSTTLPDSIPTMWNMIGAIPGSGEAHLGEVSHIGIAWVELNYAYVFFGNGNATWAATYATGKYYGGTRARNGWENRVPNGSHPWDNFAGLTTWGGDTALLGSKRFVFGCRLNNSTVPNYAIKMASDVNQPTWVMDDGGFKWFARIGVYGKHIFVANNVIAKPTHSFIFQQDCKPGGNVTGTNKNFRFDYADCIGIDINKSSMSGFWNRCLKNDSSGFYAEDVIMQDNWIYNHGNKGCEIAGKWTVAKNNVNNRQTLYTADVYGIADPDAVMDSDGRCYAGVNSADFQARAFDIGGWNVWVHNNRYTGTGSMGNDGEGILIQRHNGVEALSFAYTYNEQGSTGENGYLAPYDVHVIGLLHGWNRQRGAIGVLNTYANWLEDIACPKEINTDLTNSPIFPSGDGATNAQDFLTTCDSSKVTVNDTVVNLSVVFDAVNYRTIISYTDNSSQEIGFRIEKRKANTSDPWIVVAYRPRQQTNTISDYSTISTTSNYGPSPTSQCWPSNKTINDMNLPMWIDYKANPGESYEYRVATIDCDDDDTAATSVKIINNVKAATQAKAALSLKVIPNPVTNSAIIEYSLKNGQTANVDILDISGKVIANLASGTSANTVVLPQGLLKSGIYLVRVMASNGAGVIDKIIVQ